MYSIRIQSEVEGFEEDLQSSLVFIMEEERRKRKREDEADPGEVKFEGLLHLHKRPKSFLKS